MELATVFTDAMEPLTVFTDAIEFPTVEIELPEPVVTATAIEPKSSE